MLLRKKKNDKKKLRQRGDKYVTTKDNDKEKNML